VFDEEVHRLAKVALAPGGLQSVKRVHCVPRFVGSQGKRKVALHVAAGFHVGKVFLGLVFRLEKGAANLPTV
jgi:hypothetical protein